MLDRIELLERLAELHREGALTDDEYQREKTKLLSSDGAADLGSTKAFDDLRYASDACAVPSRADEELLEPVGDEPWREQLRDIEEGEEKPGLQKALMFGAAILFAVVGFSFAGLGAPQIRWSMMTEAQLKRELLASTGKGMRQYLECLTTFDGSSYACTTAEGALSEMGALAKRVCASNPGGESCKIEQQASENIGNIRELRQSGRELDDSFKRTQESIERGALENL